MVQRFLDHRHPMTHRHVDCRTDRDMAAGVLDHSPRRVIDPNAMNVFVARPQQPCTPEFHELFTEVVSNDVQDSRHAHFTRKREGTGIEVQRQRKCQQLVGRSEIRPLQPLDILGVLCVRPRATMISKDRPNA
jgi:hypothetical protein